MEQYLKILEQHEKLMLDTYDYIWKNPETGYREWKAHRYLKHIFESLGYEVVEAGNIPGFYAEVDTGREGPTLGIFGEMDGLLVPTHPEADPETGAVHACGHCMQTAALVGLAAAFREPDVIKDLCGKIRLIAVPAEEGVELEFRQALMEDGVIHSKSGKVEFLYRGMLDGVDLSYMVHADVEEEHVGYLNSGSNGLISKLFCFKGVSAHAATGYKGVNALYAAHTALAAINALRETFRDEDHIRVHPIISQGGASVNAIPDEVKLETYVRGATMDAIVDANRKINRAIAASAAAIGAWVEITDIPGSWPRWNDRTMMKAFCDVMDVVCDRVICKTDAWNAGCSDMGDMASVMPTIHGYIGGAAGTEHGSDYRIPNPKAACMDAAKIQLGVAKRLLENGAKCAKEAIEAYAPYFKSKEEYIAYHKKIARTYDAVRYEENGNVTLNIG